MTEATVVRKLIKLVKQARPGAVVYKHADMVTAGIPDVSVTWRGRVTWLEVKYLRRGETVRGARKKFDKRQLTQCLRLEAQQACFYVIAYDTGMGLMAALVLPSQVRLELEENRGSFIYVPFDRLFIRGQA